MQQRRLRLGDILDDYCPRERRITNHAVVAMIDDEVKQTRCTTCDADHEYKQAKVPPQRRKRAAAGADAIEAALRLRTGSDQPLPHDEADELEPAAESSSETAPEPEPVAAVPFLPEVPDPESSSVAAAPDDDGPVHRRLIRATLPRPDGQMPERKIPDFTIRQHGGGRGRDFNGKPLGQGRRPARGDAGAQPSRFGGPRHGGGGPRPVSGQGPRPQGNRSARAEGQRGNGPAGSRGRGRKRGR